MLTFCSVTVGIHVMSAPAITRHAYIQQVEGSVVRIGKSTFGDDHR